MNAENSKVAEFLTDIQAISVEQFEIISKVRDLFLAHATELVDDIKYGGLVFLHDGKLTGGIFPYTAHLSIEFSHGAQLDDPYFVLEGSGKHRRHIKLHSFDDISNKHVDVYIQNALNNKSN
ncbi:MAG: hypothetical protein COC04_04050 [Gammaproteobacteria bacterium]|nr:MAG: hypothetical protein COC04_04050 [Gammaproteobacteria bacterium]